MASVFLYHVVGDLTVGKPELSEFSETETVGAAIGAIGDSAEGGIPVWRKRSVKSPFENAQSRQQRFIGILNALDIVAFLARDDCLADQEKAINTPVSEIVTPANSALKVVDPGTRLIDALEMMKQGARRLLVPKSLVWRGMSKRFSILYNGKWLKNADSFGGSSSTNALATRPSSSSTSSIQDKFCCLSREDVLRFLIGCLGALAPLPLSSIASLEAINPNYCWIEASSPAIDATKKLPNDPCAAAVVEPTPEGQHKILGEISLAKLWKCDYLSAAWALAKLSAGQFVMGVEDHMNSRSLPDIDTHSDEIAGEETNGAAANSNRLRRKFSSRSIGFFSNSSSDPNLSIGRSMYRGRTAPLTCKATSSLAAVMAQMLSHRATHVWVTEIENDDILVGLVGYTDILAAVTRQPAAAAPATLDSNL
ncbi:CBS domain-containing protein CBSX6 [Salvia hispanica]|uniref:CBS domain-containing protein CBSX6 n=1 Tax=Salvia hispanica TaxID=49212 RepID=UPI0020097462|nr:CBS domain-containing protein CBSX6 [Salvia hispanica]XP_047966561.1 CBS domain-containing protein CBSX6 [Salvia hispanica]